VHATVDELVAMRVDERRALGYMHPGRADVIGAGALILDRILARTHVAELLVSESDILDGIAWSLA
jgi:exopolyphosphatase/guanosine-5'-triphosphate,3'-diphosphate pyrophosphatase